MADKVATRRPPHEDYRLRRLFPILSLSIERLSVCRSKPDDIPTASLIPTILGRVTRLYYREEDNRKVAWAGDWLGISPPPLPRQRGLTDVGPLASLLTYQYQTFSIAPHNGDLTRW